MSEECKTCRKRGNGCGAYTCDLGHGVYTCDHGEMYEPWHCCEACKDQHICVNAGNYPLKELSSGLILPCDDWMPKLKPATSTPTALSLQEGGERRASLYASLEKILSMALDQASNGKGKERHAEEGEPFEKQQICEITRRVGHGFPLGQAVKKIQESQRLKGEHRINELLGAINYIAASIIVEMGEVE